MEQVLEAIVISSVIVSIEEIATCENFKELKHCYKSSIYLGYMICMSLVVISGVSIGHMCSRFMHQYLARLLSSVLFSLLSFHYLRESFLLFKSPQPRPSKELQEPMQNHVWKNDLRRCLWVFNLSKWLSKSQITITVLSMNYYSFDILIGAFLSIIIIGLINTLCINFISKSITPWSLSLISGLLFFACLLYDLLTFFIQ